MAIQAQIIIVEDDQSMSSLVKTLLTSQHHTVAVANSVADARRLVKKSPPDLLILDRNLPDQDGLEFCRELRESPQTRAIPILFLTGLKTLTEKVTGLKLGADEYITKPFHSEELLARVDAVLRRTHPGARAGAVMTLDEIQIDPEGRAARLDGKDLTLTNKEFDLLRALVERRDRVLSRQFLLSHVWGYGPDVEISTRAVDMVVVGLRKKLGKWGDRIEAVKSHGYCLRSRS